MDIRAVCLALLVIVGTGFQPAVADDPQAVYGKTVDGWIAVIRAKTSTDDERRQAMRALSFFGEAANTAVPDLAEFIRQWRFKAEASAALARVGPRVEESVQRSSPGHPTIEGVS